MTAKAGEVWVPIKKVAIHTRDLPDFTGHAALYKLTEPVSVGYDKDSETTIWVIASGTSVPFSGSECLVFPSNKAGEITSWGEIAGVRGSQSHIEALASLGFEIEVSI